MASPNGGYDKPAAVVQLLQLYISTSFQHGLGVPGKVAVLFWSHKLMHRTCFLAHTHQHK